MRCATWLAGALVLGACGGQDGDSGAAVVGEQAGPEVVRVTAGTLAGIAPGDMLLVDLTLPRVYDFDPSEGAIDYGKLEIVSPNYARMDMSAWMAARSAEAHRDVSLAGMAPIALGPASLVVLTTEVAEPGSGCYHCIDGAYVCVPASAPSTHATDPPRPPNSQHWWWGTN